MKKASLIFLLGILLYGCSSSAYENDADYFNGKIKEVNDKSCQTKNVAWKELILNGPNYGEVYVHDSIMVFYNSKLGDKFFNVFHVDTGEELGRFCEKGNGLNEVIACSPMYSFFQEEGELRTLLWAPHNNKLWDWNITQSLKQQKTIVKDIPYPWRKENNGVFYENMYALTVDSLLVKNPAKGIYYDGDETTLPFYQKRTISTNQQIKKYDIYKQIIKNEDAYILDEFFFNSSDAIKPDGSKLVMAMRNLPQINIINLKTGEVCGYRLKGGDGFSVFKGDGNMKIHYQRVHADDHYIYASYLGKNRDSDPRSGEPSTQTIHVFDWEGNMRYKLMIEGEDGAGKFFVDTVRNRLYSVHDNKDEVSYLDLKTILD